MAALYASPEGTCVARLTSIPSAPAGSEPYNDTPVDNRGWSVTSKSPCTPCATVPHVYVCPAHGQCAHHARTSYFPPFATVVATVIATLVATFAAAASTGAAVASLAAISTPFSPRCANLARKPETAVCTQVHF